MNKAEIYFLPVPPFSRTSEDWEELNNGVRTLSLPALTALRKAIDDYERDQRERKQSWAVALASITSAITGVIGALIGLIVILG